MVFEEMVDTSSVSPSSIDGDLDNVETFSIPEKKNASKQTEESKFLDSRIREKLDNLNHLMERINRLENQLDAANNTFRIILKESTDKLHNIAQNLGKRSIKHGRDYHEARIKAEKIQIECQAACLTFERANNTLLDAKKAITVAESRLKLCSAHASSLSEQTKNGHNCIAKSDHLDLNALLHSLESDCTKDEISSSHNTSGASSLTQVHGHDDAESVSNHTSLNVDPGVDNQIHGSSECDIYKNRVSCRSEELNKALMMLIKAEKFKDESQIRHQDTTNKLIVAQKRLAELEREYRASIRKSKPYFDESNRLNAKLSDAKSVVDKLSQEIVESKALYSRALRELESLSTELHDKRKSDMAVASVRETDEC